MADLMGVVPGLKAAYEIARAAKDVNDQTRLNTAISEILEQLTSAQFGLLEMQQQHQQLLDENRQLREKVEKEERFECYRLERTRLGGYIMPLKEEYVSPDQPAHAICVHCREDGKRSVLAHYEYNYYCNSCKTSVHHTEIPSNPPSSTGDSWCTW
ncbi:hypothetical protein [Billgrantia bachuensis]|uniref:Uncharacterized protein n=1 Tax=Billgrantia bachuensis TaxID=2717286 RepID=A0ABX0PRC6_9GAMM|nr:hypothetical protein [Halomonas bachuensis]NIC05760.1 hypothetical protein [Halomonas bachuensis]